MRSISFLIFCLLIFNELTYSQYEVIYSSPGGHNIISIVGFENNYNDETSFYISVDGDYVTPIPPYCVRWFRSSNLFNSNPHHEFLNGTTTPCEPIIYNKVKDFLRFPSDTNFFIARWDIEDCFEVSYNNRITYNSGSSYSSLSNNIAMYTFDFHPSNENIIYGAGTAFLESPRFWKSTNKGVSWSGQTISVGFSHYFYLKVNPLNPNSIAIAANNRVLRSFDGGATINHISTIPTLSEGIYFDKADTSLYITSIVNGILRSTNGGYNFVNIFKIGCYSMMIDPDNHNILYAGTYQGLYRSGNAGADWQRYFYDTNAVIGIEKFKNDGDTIFFATNSSLFKIWDRVVKIKQNTVGVPSNFQLSQNYPNPFNPVTKIRFDIPPDLKNEMTGVRLCVYNSLGKEIVTLVDQRFSPGSYEVDFDGATLPSGLYLYKLTTNKFNKVMRMMLVK